MSLTIIQPTVTDEPIIGIDLGTTYSLVAVPQDDTAHVVRDENGDSRVPSVMSFIGDQVQIGASAKKRLIEDPDHTVYSIKRLIGRTMDDLKQELKTVPYQVVERELEADRKVLHVKIDEQEHTPEELSSLVLCQLASRGARHLGKKVVKAVVTVPAYFDETQRQATRDAGRLAGLDIVRIINEPTAAALAYGLQKRSEGTIAVYDFGGGTFDCSILTLNGGIFRVLSTNGDTLLGGDDIDRLVTESLEKQLPENIDCTNLHTQQILRDIAEQMKIELTEKPDSKHTTELEGQTVEFSLSKIEFENLITPLINKTITCCANALQDAELTPDEVDEVILVGGSSRIPLVHSKVESYFGKKPKCEINPDEVVAMGAAVQAGILSGQLKNLLLLDITPLSLGIETMGGVVSKLIGRNSTIPCKATERFTTFADNQTGVDIHVLQGERELVQNCRSLGRFKLRNVPPMPAGIPQIDVTFMLDADGMLQVSAKELKSGAEATIEVQPSQGLRREEVEQMIKDSIEHAKDDFATRRWIELKNKAETNIRHTRKSLQEQSERISELQKQSIETTLEELDQILSNENADQLQAALDQLDEATQPLVESMMNHVVAETVVGKSLDEA